MILGGVLGYTLSYLFENVGLALSTASEISLMMGVFPVLSLLVEGLAYHRRFSHATVAGIALFGSIALLPLAGVFERPTFPVPAATVWLSSIWRSSVRSEATPCTTMGSPE